MEEIRAILQKVLDGQLSPEQAEGLLKADYIERVGNLAQLDLQRCARTGIPEIIFAETKTLPILLEITKTFLEKNGYAIITRVGDQQQIALQESFGIDEGTIVEIDAPARIAVVKQANFSTAITGARVGIITAGSSDIPVAEEARLICEYMGCSTTTAYDVGVAGMHRIFAPLKEMVAQKVDVIIVCAGMEGTLPGIVASLVDMLVIAVPTSSGYGHGGRGEGALTTMLQSCVPGLVVVNIDNGVGAGASAALIANRMAALRSEPIC
jgi:hypothetical protein